MIKIKNEELVQALIGEPNDFPKYTTQLINIANRNAKGTAPKVVGQLSELINECPEKTYEGWKAWYLAKYPHAIENAISKIFEMIQKLEAALKLVDKSMIEKWVKDLVIEKTFIGLRFQEAIIKKVASLKNESYRFADTNEESQGIDGFIGEIPISIKPVTYKSEVALKEVLKGKVIFYEKTKEGLEIDASSIIDD